jgi:hypothetical protein
MMEAETETDPNYESITPPAAEDIAVQHDASAHPIHDRSIGGTVSKIACGFALASLLHYISVAFAAITFISGGILIGVGTTLTMPELRYVAYAFGAAACIVAIFFMFRSFSLMLAIHDLEKVRNEMQDTAQSLHNENKELKLTLATMHTTAAGLEKTNGDLRATADGMTDMLASMEADGADMRKQIAALTECNERFRTAIGALVTAGSQSADLTKMINDSLQSIKQLETNLQDERKRQEAFTTHLTAAILAQMDGNGDGSIDAIEQQKWLGKLARV